MSASGVVVGVPSSKAQCSPIQTRVRFEVERRAGAAGRHQHAAPVGVAPGDHRLDKRRGADRARRDPRVRVRGRALGDHLDQRARTLAVARQLAREPHGDRLDGARQRRGSRVAGVDRIAAGGAVREGDHHVRGRGVHVHVDHVEGAVGDLAQGVLQPAALDRGVRGEEAEHRRHVRVDHARALGRAADDVGTSAGLDAQRGLLGARVGRHHRARELRPALAAQLDLGDARLDAIDRQAAADHAGRADEHVGRLDAEPGRRQLGHALRVGRAGSAGGDVGVAGVDDERPRDASGDALAREHEGAPTTALRVKSAAAVAGRSESSSPRSKRGSGP